MRVRFPDSTRRIATLLHWAFLTVTSLAVFVPFNPRFPVAKLDSSWMFAMNQAVAQKLVFGKEIIFTFGPYASIYTEMYHPATDHLMIWGSLFIGVCYALMLILLAKGKGAYWVLLYAVFLAGYVMVGANDPLLVSRDSLLLSYPLILAMLVYRVTLADIHLAKLNVWRFPTIALAILLAPLGLLPLIKGSLFMSAGAVAAICFVLFWRNGQKVLAYGSLAVPAISTALFWVVAGQPIVALPTFLLNMTRIISGYTEAMALDGKGVEIGMYIAAAVFILCSLFRAVSNESDPRISQAALLLSFAIFLFVSFKAGFVRHDIHAVTAGSSIVMASLLINTVKRSRMAGAAVLLALVTWGYIDPTNTVSAPRGLYDHFADTYMSALEGMRLRMGTTDVFRRTLDYRLSAIKRASPIPILQGTTDTYSYHQSELLASGNRWSPRPIVQSYSAYTPVLEGLNEEHLQNDQSPDNVLFRLEAIDGRLPALEDGLSWPALINNYSLTTIQDDVAYLRKRATPQKDLSGVELSVAQARLGDKVYMPNTKEALFAEIGIAPTLSGRFMSLVFKPPQLSILLHLNDGTERRYRIISGMAKARFLISPLIETTKEFTLLSSPDTALANKVVKAFEISPSGGKSIFWNDTYSVTFSTISLTKDTDRVSTGFFYSDSHQGSGTIRQITESQTTMHHSKGE
jgi:hypothetical protein